MAELFSHRDEPAASCRQSLDFVESHTRKKFSMWWASIRRSKGASIRDWSYLQISKLGLQRYKKGAVGLLSFFFHYQQSASSLPTLLQHLHSTSSIHLELLHCSVTPILLVGIPSSLLAFTQTPSTSRPSYSPTALRYFHSGSPIPSQYLSFVLSHFYHKNTDIHIHRNHASSSRCSCHILCPSRARECR